ncbi:MAG: hypothetical protein Q4E34_04265 [Synergistaceae bacterium]|nr:hypothetical protein [Synergistaceae bacterium]
MLPYPGDLDRDGSRSVAILITLASIAYAIIVCKRKYERMKAVAAVACAESEEEKTVPQE